MLTSRVLHAGFHKTGSTFLQREFFPKLEGIVFVRNLDLGRIPILRKGQMSIVFSNEAACGYPYPYTESFNTDRLQSNIEILKIDRVIIVKRECYFWIISLHYQTLNEKMTWSLEEFLQKNSANLLTWNDATFRIECMCKEKGLEILLIEHQQLIANPKYALDQISSFILGSRFIFEKIASEKRTNFSRYGSLTIKVYRFLNRCFDNRLGRLIERATGIGPRKLIGGKFGGALDKISSSALSADDVQRLLP